MTHRAWQTCILWTAESMIKTKSGAANMQSKSWPWPGRSLCGISDEVALSLRSCARNWTVLDQGLSDNAEPRLVIHLRK